MTSHHDRSNCGCFVSECTRISWIWSWMQALIAVSSVELAASITAVILVFLIICTNKIERKTPERMAFILQILILVQFFRFINNKNLAIANRSRVSCAHNTSRASIGLILMLNIIVTLICGLKITQCH